MKFIFSLLLACALVSVGTAQRAVKTAPLVPNVQNDFIKERTLLRWKQASLTAGLRYEKTMLPAQGYSLMENNRQYTVPVFYRRDLGQGLFWETGLYAGLGRCSYNQNVIFPNDPVPLAAQNQLIYGAIAGLSLVVSDNLRLNLRYRETFGTGPRANFGKLRLGWQVRF